MSNFPKGRALFVVPTLAEDPISDIARALGLLFSEAGHKVGHVKPVAEAGVAADEIAGPFVSRRNAELMIRQDRTADLLDEVVGIVVAARGDREFMIVEGVAPLPGHSLLDDLNYAMARGLSCDVIPYVSGDTADPQDVIDRIEDVLHGIRRSRGRSPIRVIVGAPADPERAGLLRALIDERAFACPCDLIETTEPATSTPFPPARIERLADGMRDWFPELSRDPRLRRLTPPLFRYRMVEMARKANKRIVLPEGDEPRTLQAAAICAEKGIARCVLLGQPEEVRASAEAIGVTLPDTIEILNPADLRPRYIEPMVALRKNKGLTPEQADEALRDRVVLGTMMLAEDDVDGLVSGAVHTTANTVRPALQLIKTRPGASLVSSVFFMLMPEEVFVYGDCAVNPDPNAEQLAEIAVQTADTAITFGIDPKIAMISYSTGDSGQGADVDKVKAATARVRELRPDLTIDGPLQYDAASVESVGRTKAPGSTVAGRANVFIFPDLNTGNTTYKAVQRSAGVVSIGPMLQGLRKPVNDLSRGSLVDDIVYTIVLTAIQAMSSQQDEAGLTRTAAE
ncbi:phosphate acetyltransferase [Breoghania corrubedonensis]|uniref:Phosphate acetyltransferase n=1 Tax=Breoghania corrubedonensis TaxID=665038 RepID=A0A2T5VI30_9HYPH|nr:phosphate acetyltransferase [Breoghania corrubedonensis]PTW63412.1 phosphate acetyltransferase [Breoghania corrubedonensis]